MNVLEYYSKAQKTYIRFPLADPTPIDKRLTPAVERFVLWMRENSYVETTIHTHERMARRLLDSAASYGLEDTASLDSSHISNFTMKITGHLGKVSCELNSLRVFFRYLHQNGMTTKNPGLFIPAPNRLRLREHLPAVWKKKTSAQSCSAWTGTIRSGTKQIEEQQKHCNINNDFYSPLHCSGTPFKASL